MKYILHNRNLNIFEINNLECESGKTNKSEVDRYYNISAIHLLGGIHNRDVKKGVYYD